MISTFRMKLGGAAKKSSINSTKNLMAKLGKDGPQKHLKKTDFYAVFVDILWVEVFCFV